MPRKRKDKGNDDTEARKKRVRSFRSRERRQRRENEPRDPSDLSGVRFHTVRMVAYKIINATASSPHWSYWLSIPSEGKNRNSPTADYYPCRTFIRGDRVWYGFMFREHRDDQCRLWPDAVKELTSSL